MFLLYCALSFGSPSLGRRRTHVSACNLFSNLERKSKTRGLALGLAWTLRVTANDLDPVGMHLVGIVELEVDVLDNECPYVVAEAVGIEVSL